jgi:hypothetical protein
LQKKTRPPYLWVLNVLRQVGQGLLSLFTESEPVVHCNLKDNTVAVEDPLADECVPPPHTAYVLLPGRCSSMRSVCSVLSHSPLLVSTLLRHGSLDLYTGPVAVITSFADAKRVRAASCDVAYWVAQYDVGKLAYITHTFSHSVCTPPLLGFVCTLASDPVVALDRGSL